MQYPDLSHVIETRGAHGILSDFGAADAAKREARFACHCSRERAASAVLAMGKADALALLAERGEIAVHCHYCNTDYIFGEEDLERLFGENE